MLVPHEPTLDPRVHYTAASLAKRYDVMVIAVLRDFEQRPEENYPQRPAYTTQRASLEHAGTAAMFWNFSETCVERWFRQHNFALSASLAAVLLVASAALGALLAVQLAIDYLVDARRTAFGTRGLRASAATVRFTLEANASLLRQARRIAVRANYVYCHDLYSLQAAVTLKRETGCRVIYDSHEFYPYLHRHRAFRELTKLYERVLVGFVDTYITVSPPLARALEETYGLSGIVSIPNVEPSPGDCLAHVVGEMTALAAGRVKLLYQGNFAEGRGLEEVLEEWRHVDGTRVALFLRGPQNQWRDQLEAIARKQGFLEKSVYFLAPVLERDLIAAAAEADLGLIPYKADSEAYRYACPNKLSQYLHAGLGIVANSIPFVRTMVDEYGIGVCYDVDKPQSFASAVNRLARDPAEVARLRSRAAATARDTYHWEKYEDTLLASVAAT
jgi:glycosyltransferase involved in cell wall biosynthesis